MIKFVIFDDNDFMPKSYEGKNVAQYYDEGLVSICEMVCHDMEKNKDFLYNKYMERFLEKFGITLFPDNPFMCVDTHLYPKPSKECILTYDRCVKFGIQVIYFSLKNMILDMRGQSLGICHNTLRFIADLEFDIDIMIGVDLRDLRYLSFELHDLPHIEDNRILAQVVNCPVNGVGVVPLYIINASLDEEEGYKRLMSSKDCVHEQGADTWKHKEYSRIYKKDGRYYIEEICLSMEFEYHWGKDLPNVLEKLHEIVNINDSRKRLGEFVCEYEFEKFMDILYGEDGYFRKYCQYTDEESDKTKNLKIRSHMMFLPDDPMARKPRVLQISKKGDEYELSDWLTVKNPNMAELMWDILEHCASDVDNTFCICDVDETLEEADNITKCMYLIVHAADGVWEIFNNRDGFKVFEKNLEAAIEKIQP